ncbi:Transcriptional regulator, contains XRE-family HTH domain [Streptoalloteichus tenebrarius]|uniref:Transcriptional regulator, contains XRE-family HTH domain n=1 Tax=Streptoalloteichus tenebrarius (strain ATCC 17920 / DSM 40477 / JCM 4838 / CBS 697.72 / NBRC 16177 / NCIMB 11028 / NRRL B-12390 / A12253. 1 / ISP 5477) TaxID=1933 RepID=A0ABT1I4C7_STRSD|nr:helix-turn-helix transcriptional regulator [Streptoalloteichus tenebrarius]MCP2262662.1 Transcriptional regulator, contains XRE-family HTH domain [Streptoalloteichus tenebrarius]
MSVTETSAPGRNVAVLRKQRGMSQVKLARAAGVSVSLLSKVEIGDRALTQGVAAALARALDVGLDELLGAVPVGRHDEESLRELRSAIRRFDLPGEAPTDLDALRRDLAHLTKLRGDADLSGVLEKLPDLLTRVTHHAHTAGTPDAWAKVSEVYSTVYWLAARHRWMDLAELAVLKQRLAAERADPLTTAVAARDEAGTFLNSGDFAGGLAVVDRAIAHVESHLRGRERFLALGLLHLRGLTLAGRERDNAEAERHMAAAWRAAEEIPRDVNVHGIHFGPENTAVHVVATYADLERHRKALEVTDDLRRRPLTLPATRISPLHMNTARAKLALRDRDGALESLVDAWDTAPQMARVHPTSQELLRVLIALHRRSNPALVRLAKKAGLPV